MLAKNQVKRFAKMKLVQDVQKSTQIYFCEHKTRSKGVVIQIMYVRISLNDYHMVIGSFKLKKLYNGHFLIEFDVSNIYSNFIGFSLNNAQYDIR